MNARQICALSLALLVSIAATSCVTNPNRAATQIESMLMAQDAAWNAGDMEGFMDGYWNSPDLTFCSGGTVTRGWEPTLTRYRTRYPTAESRGELTFSDLDIHVLSRKAAYVLGRWRLERDKPIAGLFTLVLRRQHGRWVIVHDHTSSDAP